MNEKKCRYCGMMIPKEAKICPHCRKKLGWTWPVKIVVFLFVLFAIGAIFGKSNQPSKEMTTSAQPPPIEITSEQLYKEYSGNEVAADLKYKNRNVKVIGTVRSIGKTFGDSPYLNLSTGPISHQVMVTFPATKYDAEIATYKRGDRIEVTGTCGGMTLGMVSIKLK